MRPREQKAIHEAFLASVWLKGLVGAVQALAGIALLIVNQQAIVHFVVAATTPEMAEASPDPLAAFVQHGALQWGAGTQHFASIYLLLHGVIKLLLVIALLRGKMWSYPASIAVLGAFIAYQCFRYTSTHSPWLIALTILDIVVVALVWSEYRVRRHVVSAVA